LDAQETFLKDVQVIDASRTRHTVEKQQQMNTASTAFQKNALNTPKEPVPETAKRHLNPFSFED